MNTSGQLFGRDAIAEGYTHDSMGLPIDPNAIYNFKGIRYAEITESLTIPTVVAFVALVLGASVVGDEREDWTILYLAATPVPRVNACTMGRSE